MSTCRSGLGCLVLLAGVVWLAGGSAASAQQKLLTIDDLYDPSSAVDFGRGTTPRPVTWLDDTHYLWLPAAAGKGKTRPTVIDVASGREAPLFDAEALETAVMRLPGMTADEAAALTRREKYALSPAGTALLLTIRDDLYFWPMGAAALQRLTAAEGKEEEPAFSPDGRFVGFVRGNNLYVTDLEGRERALTTDGHGQLLNGILDWVYQEEIYGRGSYRAFWWSPDSSRLAYLQLDEAPVPEFTIVDHVPYRQLLEHTDYPKPGDPNPGVRLGVVRVDGGSTRWVQTGRYREEHLIVNVMWHPTGREIVFQLQDREQTWLDLNVADPDSGAIRTLLRETTPAWVSDHGPPSYLKDGSFLWLSERTGWKHLYRYTGDGTLLGAVTTGEWEVRTLHGVDEANGWIYFTGTERSHIGSDVYRVGLDGASRTLLSNRPGTHVASFNPSFRYYVDTWSDLTTPPQVRVHRADGVEVRVADPNPVPALATYRLSTPELMQVPTRDGFLMEAILIKPPDFDPRRRYPVYQHTYGGPQAPRVRNAWGGSTYLFHQLLAQRGIVVWICDNRSASGKGARSAWSAYMRLGDSELRDIEDGLTWLKRQPWIDPERIGISGWSYGGFMVSYALTHSRSFAMGIAGGSVTDWRGYDSIYTERYMRTPQNNPEGYARSAPQAAAADLTGELLLLHGTMDDNVHVQNTLRFAWELQRAGKRFSMMLYPRSRHGVVDPPLEKHLRQTILDFTLRTLTPGEAANHTEQTR